MISALDYWSMGEGKGGPALYRTLTGYAARGWKVYFITGNRTNGDSDAQLENVTVIRFDTPWLKRMMQFKKIGFFAHIVWWVYIQAAFVINAYRVRFKDRVDVVYGYEINGVPAAKLLSMLWRIPMVARFQGTILGLAWMKRKLWKARAWEHVLGLRTRADLVIMTNDGTQGDRVLRHLGARMERTRFWMNGVDWEPLSNAPSKEDARRQLAIHTTHVLLTVSRLVGWKCVDRSLRAMAHIVRGCPDCMLIIVGDGPERETLEALAAELGVMRSVRFEGAVPHSGVPAYLAAADVFLSLYDLSNVGNPLLEAMMAGKCILTLDNGDTATLIEDGVNGVLLKSPEEKQIADRIIALLKDSALRERLGIAARRHAEERFWSWEERLDAEVVEVEALLARRRENP